MALDLFAGAQAFVERPGLGGWRCAQLLVEQPDQLLVVPQRPPPLAQCRLAAHQPPVGILLQLVVGYGLAVGLRSLGVALLGEEEPSQEQQRFSIRSAELFLALRRPFALRRAFEEIAPVEAGGLLQMPDGLLG